MRRLKWNMVLCSILTLIGTAWAGGSNSGIAPGARPNFERKVSEWVVPTPTYAGDPASAPDGTIYTSVMYGNKFARFDTRPKTVKAGDLPEGARPHRFMVDRNGQVWYTGRWLP